MALFKKKLNNALADILPKVIPQWFQGAFQHFLTMTRKPEQQVLNRLAHLRCLQRWLSGAPHCRSLPATGPDLPSPGDLPDSGIEPTSPALQAGSLPLSHQGSPKYFIPSLRSALTVPSFTSMKRKHSQCIRIGGPISRRECLSSTDQPQASAQNGRGGSGQLNMEVGGRRCLYCTYV